MNTSKTWLKKAIVFMVVAAMAIALFPFTGLKTVTKAAVGDVPAHEKKRTDNGDGTYTLELTVTGDSDTSVQTAANVNVLIVYDISQSMVGNNVTGTSNSRADYAEDVVHDFIVSLSRYQNASDPSNIEVAVVTFGRNASIRQSWTSDLTGGSSGVNRFFDDEVDGQITNHGYNNELGTNWEHAFIQAQSLLTTLDNNGDTDPTFVVFVTDGVCTKSGTGTGNGEAPTNTRWSHYSGYYNAAADNAFAIEQRANTTLFGIYAYGTEYDLLDDLLYFANTPNSAGTAGTHRTMTVGGTTRSIMEIQDSGNDYQTYNFGGTVEGTTNYFKAADTDALNAAISTIFDQIVLALGVADAEIVDGTTNHVETSSGPIELLEVDENSYKYWLSIPVTTGQAENTYTFLRPDLTQVDPTTQQPVMVTYTVKDNKDGTCTVTWGSNTITVNGSVSMGAFKYQWVEKNALYNYDPPQAKLFKEEDVVTEADKKKVGSVIWNVFDENDNLALLKGVTYSVTFDVYPSQTTYDYIADLKNGTIKYSELPEEVQDYLIKNPDMEDREAALAKPDTESSFGLMTNTGASLSYKDTRPGGGSYGPIAFEDNLKPVPTTASKLTVKKNWDPIDEAEDITLTVTRDGENFYEIKLTKSNNFSGVVNISTGLIHQTYADADAEEKTIKEVTVLDEGHDYAFSEMDDSSYYWDLKSETVRPMLINSATEISTLVLIEDQTEASEIKTAMGENNFLQQGEETYYLITDKNGEDHVYKLSTSDTTGNLSALNQKRSNLYLYKDVTEDAPANSVFKFNLTVDAAYTEHTVDVTKDEEADDTYTYTNQDGVLVTVVKDTNAQHASGTYIAKYILEEELENGEVKKTTVVLYGTIKTIGEGDNAKYQFVFKEAMWFSMWDYDASAVVKGLTPNGWTEEVIDEASTGYYYAPTGTPLVIDNMKASNNIRFSNIPAGTTYTFIESDMPEHFILQSIAQTDTTGTIDTDNKTATGTITESNKDFSVKFTNDYVLATITVNKVWSDGDNQDDIRPETLTLTLNGAPEGTEVPDPAITGTDGNTWTYTWTGLPKYNAAGEEIEYTVSEEEVPDGYTVSGSPAKDGETITNSHTPEVTTVTVTKEWVDNDNANKTRPSSITFRLMNGTEEVASATLDGTAESAPTGTDVAGYESAAWVATFVNLPKNAAGEPIDYTVTEDTVTNYTTTGSPAVDKGKITNTYDFGALDITKTVDPGNGSAQLASNKEFTFTVNLYTDNTKAATLQGSFDYTITDGTGTVSTGTIASGGTVKLKGGQTVHIADLPIGAYYEVTEAAETGYTITTKTGDTGTIESNKTAKAAFTNTYEADPAEAQIPVKKNVTPDNSGAKDISGKFTFTLEPVGNAPMPADAVDGKATVLCGTDGATVKFGKIEFTAVGTYNYKVTESVTGGGTSVDGVGLETNVYREFSVVVTDDGNGQLSATVNGGNTPTFYNPYNVTALDITIPVEKQMERNGLTGPDITEEFTFTIADDKEDEVDSPLPTTKTIENPGPDGGSMTFGGDSTGKITVTAPGTYTYIITESGDVDGVTNDPAAATGKKVVVTVTNNGDGTMSYTINDPDDDEDNTTVFTNTYNADPVEVEIPVEKVLLVPEGMEAPVITEEFTFTIADYTEDEVDSPLPEEKTVSNPDEDGGLAFFDKIEFTAPGTYVYVITESGDVAGVVNDPAAATGKKVTVVIEDGKKGELVVKSSTSTEEAPLQFTNSYYETTVSIPVTKTLEKNPTTLEGPDIIGKYKFTIADDTTDSVDSPLPETKEITLIDGAMAFGPITFKEPGTYTYVATETETGDALPGVTNDPDAKKVTVVVTRDADGKLIPSFPEGGATSFDFVNTYTVSSVKASFPVKKDMTITGTGPESWSYTIKVEAQGEAPKTETMTDTVTNTKQTVTFGEFEFSAPGTYEYKVTESGEIPGVTNDPNATTGYTVTISVTDNKDGTLKATSSSTDDDPVTFYNSYTYSETTATLQVEKVVTCAKEGITPPDIKEKYTFTLVPGDHTYLDGTKGKSPMPATGGETVKNPASNGGLAAFGTITFKEPGTYTYTITESGGVYGITNDPEAESGKTVTVTVVDDQQGALVSTVDYGTGKAQAVFTNTLEMGDLIIDKTVQKFSYLPDAGKVTFIYHIVATMNGKTVYDDYEALQFNAEDPTFNHDQVKIVGKIPVGATVTVTEENDGAGYKSYDEKTKVEGLVITDPKEAKTATASFTNTFGDEIPSGYGITNHYTKEKDGWTGPSNDPVTK